MSIFSRLLRVSWLYGAFFLPTLGCQSSPEVTPAPRVSSPRAPSQTSAPRVVPALGAPTQCATAGQCLQVAHTLRGDQEARKTVLIKACQLDPRSCNPYMRLLRESEDLEGLRTLSSWLCKQHENTQACARVGMLYLKKEPVHKDLAKEHLEYGCDRGSALACFNLAVAHERQWLDDVPMERLIALFERACKGGYNGGCQNLAIMHLHEGPDYDVQKALDLFEYLCNRGHATSCSDLGSRLVKGQGVTQDEARGLALLEKSCDGRTKDHAYGCAFYGQALLRHMKAGDPQGAQGLKALLKGCTYGEGRGCEWAADHAAPNPVLMSAKEVQETYARAFELYHQECVKERSGKRCGLAAYMIINGQATALAEYPVQEYIRMACAFDKRVCSWDFSADGQ